MRSLVTCNRLPFVFDYSLKCSFCFYFYFTYILNITLYCFGVWYLGVLVVGLTDMEFVDFLYLILVCYYHLPILLFSGHLFNGLLDLYGLFSYGLCSFFEHLFYLLVLYYSYTLYSYIRVR